MGDTLWPNGITLRVHLEAYLSSDHISPATGKTIAITISKNGGAFGNPSAGATNATEISNGSYYVDLSSTDTGTNGPLIVRGTSSGVDDLKTGFLINTNRLGLSTNGIIKNTAVNNFGFFMFDSNGNPVPGATVSGVKSLDGGAFSALTNSVVEVGSGLYKVNLAAGDVNGNTVSLAFTATGTKNTVISFVTLL